MIEINNLHKRFNENSVLNGVSLKIDSGETIVIVGRSGCGKSVLIKHVVGLLYPDSGYVKVEDQTVNELSEEELYKLRRKFGFLFQGAALFDSMTVEENIALPLVESGQASVISGNGSKKNEIKKLIEEKLEMVGLPGIQKLKPAELSGGMKKRVGLARALITNPDYIFYDEPTTGLDPIMADSIDNLIKELSEKLSVTSVVVTHDMYSVKNVADRVAMMHEGKIYFAGTPQQFIDSGDKVITDFIKRTEV